MHLLLGFKVCKCVMLKINKKNRWQDLKIKLALYPSGILEWLYHFLNSLAEDFIHNCAI
jgi:hypothetical protein